MQVQKYNDWSFGVHQRLSARRIPISGLIEVTQLCNNKCIHCYNNLPGEVLKAKEEELSFAEYRRILDEIVDAGCLWLLFTGGEIFIRKDFIDIYTYARQKGLLITLFTNGTLISSEIADRLAQLPPFSIEVTLYGRTKATYESITRVAGSYERCINGIRMLMNRKLPLKLKTMVIEQNKHELHEMKRFVEKELKLEFKFDAMINPRRDFSQSPLDVRLTPAEVVELDLRYPDRVSEWKRFAGQFNKSVLSPAKAARLYVCGGGQNSFAINPFGRLAVCVLSPDDSFDLRRGEFKRGWEKYLMQLRQKKVSRKTKCSACQIKSMCGMCPASSELECRDAEAPVDFLCQVAHLRTYALGYPIVHHGPCEYCEGGSGYVQMMEMVKMLKGLSYED